MKGEKRYQVFVSSTYEDLLEERQEVIQALLELDTIPSGMELFPAANDDQWTLIKRVIDDCDYYILIIGGRYGSIGASGKSYTQMEYEYAVDRNKPVIAFLHKDPSVIPLKKTEKSEEGRNKLEQFRSLAEQRMCRYWTSSAELGSVVSRSLIKLTKTTHAIGWVRANEVRVTASAEDVLKLKDRIEELENELAQIASRVPEGTESLSQGYDHVKIKFGFIYRKPESSEIFPGATWEIDMTWNELFAKVSPLMINPAPDTALLQKWNLLVQEKAQEKLRDVQNWTNNNIIKVDINDDDFRGIIVQFRALKMIVECDHQKIPDDSVVYFRLTPYGDSIMTALRAVTKSVITADPAGTSKSTVPKKKRKPKRKVVKKV